MIATAFEADNNTILGALLVGLIIFAGGLLSAMGVIMGWIREVAGVKETTSTEIAGQPIRFVKEDKPMTVGQHTAVCGHLGDRVTKLEGEVKEIRRKMERDKDEIIHSGEERAKDLHRRIDGIPHQVIALLKDTKGLIE
jgi:hypothetical protein